MKAKKLTWVLNHARHLDLEVESQIKLPEQERAIRRRSVEADRHACRGLVDCVVLELEWGIRVGGFRHARTHFEEGLREVDERRVPQETRADDRMDKVAEAERQ
jgi:hypothetical protein